MSITSFTLPSDDGVQTFVYRWAGKTPKAVVQIAHGMGEHAGRYADVAKRLAAAGYDVYANDHRGHGRSVVQLHDLGVFGKTDGWNRLVADCLRLNTRIHEQNPGLPVIFLGHSMGSAAGQQYMVEHGDTIAGMVLSGSTAFDALAGLLDVVRPEAERLGHRGQSELLAQLSFGGFNQAFQPARTDFDWLSRDPDQVDAYIADERCGFTVAAQAWLELLEAAVRFSEPAALARIPKQLPIYLLAGDKDPVNSGLVGLETLIERYREAGLKDLTWRFYPDGRHEMFNETNREAVIADLIDWLGSIVPAK